MDANDKKEYILCSAVKRLKERECFKIYYEEYQDIYKIEIGWRHPDILTRFEGEVSKNPYDQGFYTSKGRYVDRKEAAQIAFKEGQIDKELKYLTSEDLY